MWQTYYASVLGCDPLTTGKHLGVTGVVRFVGNFLGVIRTIIAGVWVAFFQECQQSSCGQATLETALQKMGYKQLNIRKGVCLVNNTVQAAFW